jgi:hypothetical protein
VLVRLQSVIDAVHGALHETLALDEPEALIVEIEDIVEETAAPLASLRPTNPTNPSTRDKN